MQAYFHVKGLEIDHAPCMMHRLMGQMNQDSSLDADLLERILQIQDQLSGKKRIVAKYVLDHHIEAAFLRASDLAKRTDVSEPTIVRFAMDLGYPGYAEFRETLQTMVQRELTVLDRLREYHEHVEDEDDPAVKVLGADMANLESTFKTLNVQQLHRVADQIIEARHVYAIGVRASAVLAQFLEILLKRVLTSISSVTSSADFFLEQLPTLDERDLVIAFGFPRYPNEVLHYLQAAKEMGIPTIAITDSQLSPLTEWADEHLLARCQMIAMMESYVAPVSLIGTLSTLVGLKLEEETLPQFRTLEQLWEQYDIFHQD